MAQALLKQLNNETMIEVINFSYLSPQGEYPIVNVEIVDTKYGRKPRLTIIIEDEYKHLYIHTRYCDYFGPILNNEEAIKKHKLVFICEKQKKYMYRIECN